MEPSTGDSDASSVSCSGSAEDTLDECAKTLDELRMKILRSSVRCHMLEVDLATQFNPQNLQAFSDAEESCQNCSRDVSNLHTEVEKCVKDHVRTSPQKQQGSVNSP